jgi:hypothetical protein
VLFARGRPLQLRARLTVAPPVPTTPLPKAIIKVTLKGGPNGATWAEKTFKQKNVPANSAVLLPFSADELAHLPANQVVTAVAEMRWLTNGGAGERRALGSQEFVLVDRYFLGEVGPASGPERELTDMQRYRSFWNKVWEAPTLHAVDPGDEATRKYNWALDVAAKYTILLSPDHPANGLMQTRLQRKPPEPDSLTDTTQGRLKAGIELSVAELNKLLPAWDNRSPLDEDRLAALSSDVFARGTGGELVTDVALKGRAGQRGMVWVVPVFQLFDVRLGVVQSTDDAGQVLAAGEERTQFPLPAAARVIGLKASDDTSDSTGAGAEDQPEYRFDGFSVEVSKKVMLTPPGRGAGPPGEAARP